MCFKFTEHDANHPSVNGGNQAALSLDGRDCTCTVAVRGFQQPISQEMMELYFTNASKSGGGDISDIVMKEKEIFIMFTNQAGGLYLFMYLG